MYRGREDFERFADAAETCYDSEEEMAGLLNRLSCYLGALLSQVEMRTVLAEGQPPSLPDRSAFSPEWPFEALQQLREERLLGDGQVPEPDAHAPPPTVADDRTLQRHVQQARLTDFDLNGNADAELNRGQDKAPFPAEVEEERRVALLTALNVGLEVRPLAVRSPSLPGHRFRLSP